MVRRLPPQSPRGRECLCVFFFCMVCLCCYVSPGPTQYIFHTPMTRYSLFVVKVSLNSSQPTIALHALPSKEEPWIRVKTYHTVALACYAYVV